MLKITNILIKKLNFIKFTKICYKRNFANFSTCINCNTKDDCMKLNKCKIYDNDCDDDFYLLNNNNLLIINENTSNNYLDKPNYPKNNISNESLYISSDSLDSQGSCDLDFNLDD